MNNQIDINLQAKGKGLSIYEKPMNVGSLRKMVVQILKALDVQNHSISLLFCDNKMIRDINLTFRQQNKATDVLAFESDTPHFLGDIAISLDQALDQSKSYNVCFEMELLRLLIHGILHLLGYDHERSREDEQIMKSLEESIILEVQKIAIC